MVIQVLILIGKWVDGRCFVRYFCAFSACRNHKLAIGLTPEPAHFKAVPIDIYNGIGRRLRVNHAFECQAVDAVFLALVTGVVVPVDPSDDLRILCE